MAANLRAIKKEYEKAREIAPKGVIGFNIMVALRHYEDYVQAAADAGADLIISGAGLPTELPRPIVSGARSAGVILKLWDRKYNRVPDLLVIEGPKAGGHLGFTKEQLADYLENGAGDFDEEIRKILAVVKEYGDRYQKKIPIAIAGGIENREQVMKRYQMFS